MLRRSTLIDRVLNIVKGTKLTNKKNNKEKGNQKNNYAELLEFKFEQNKNPSYKLLSFFKKGSQQYTWGKKVYTAKLGNGNIKKGNPVYIEDRNKPLHNTLKDKDGNTIFEKVIYVPVGAKVNLSALAPTMKFYGDRVYKDNMLLKWKNENGKTKTTDSMYNWQNDCIIRVEKLDGNVVTDVAVYKIVTYLEDEPRLHSFDFLYNDNNFLSDDENEEDVEYCNSLGYIYQGYEKVFCPILRLNRKDAENKEWVPNFKIHGDKVTLIKEGGDKRSEIEIKSGEKLPVGIIPLYPKTSTLRVYLNRRGTMTFREYEICMCTQPLIKNITFTDDTKVSYETVPLLKKDECVSIPNFYFIASEDYTDKVGIYNWDMLAKSIKYNVGWQIESKTNVHNYNVFDRYSYKINLAYKHIKNVLFHRCEKSINDNNVEYTALANIKNNTSPAVLKEFKFVKEIGNRNENLFKDVLKAEISTSLELDDSTNNEITINFLKNEHLEKLIPMFNFSGNRVYITYDGTFRDGIMGRAIQISSGIDTINLSNAENVKIKIEYDTVLGNTKERIYDVNVLCKCTSTVGNVMPNEMFKKYGVSLQTAAY